MSTRTFVTALLPFFVLSHLGIASATTFYVDASVTASGDGATWTAAFKTIQQGIDAASEGDTVIVAQGTYVENIHFKARVSVPPVANRPPHAIPRAARRGLSRGTWKARALGRCGAWDP